MADVIKGSDVIVSLLVGGDYLPIFCAESMNLRVQREVVLKTGANSQKWREKTTRLGEWFVTVSGLTKIANGSEVAWFYLAQDGVLDVAQTVKISFTDDEATTKYITGTVIITGLQLSASPDDFASCQVDMEGSGAPTLSDTDPIISNSDNVDVYRKTLTGGETSISTPLSGSYSTLLAFYETDEWEVITSGTPGNQQIKYDSATGTFSWSTDNPGLAGQRITILYKSV